MNKLYCFFTYKGEDCCLILLLPSIPNSGDHISFSGLGNIYADNKNTSILAIEKNGNNHMLSADYVDWLENEIYGLIVSRRQYNMNGNVELHCKLWS